MNNTRTIHCDDALIWLNGHDVMPGSSLVGSLPDISEFSGMPIKTYKEWFESTASLILSRTPPEGVTIFYQSDIKHEGIWVDKAYLCQKAAEQCGHELLWHKVVCRYPAGTITFGRPAYTHLICFSKSFRPDLAKSTMDVLPDIGEKTWERGMGLEAGVMIAKFIHDQVKSHTLINPFCGQGGLIAAAQSLGLNAIGIERSPKRAEMARLIQISSDFKSFIV